MFQVNDVVRLIPSNYDCIHKSYNLHNYWYAYNAVTDEHVMLGGKYCILTIAKNDNGYIFYSLLPNAINYGGSVLGDDLLLDVDVKNCPFKVGDSVKFALTDDEAKRQAFPLWNKAYSFDDKNAIYKVTAVLNDFYIFLNYEKDALNSAPFRWDNFENV